MITDCFGAGASRYYYNLQEWPFFIDVLLLLIAISPIIVGYTVWRILLSNRASFRVSAILRLDENSETCSDSVRRIPWLTVFIYVLTVGVFAFEALPYVQDYLLNSQLIQNAQPNGRGL